MVENLTNEELEKLYYETNREITSLDALQMSLKIL